MEDARARRARALRYKRAALDSLGFEFMWNELEEMRESLDTIHWWTDQDEEMLINVLDGDTDDVWEFKMMFADLENKADQLFNILLDMCRHEENFGRTFDDCTVALVGNRYRTVGFDFVEEDYFALTSYEGELAQTEAGKRLMRRTKPEIIAIIGQCLGILIAYLDLRQQYDYLKATFDVLVDENTSILQQIKEIETVYQEVAEAGWNKNYEAEKRLDRLVAAMPDRAWLE